MLRYAIPRYRLPDRVLKREIDWIKGLGIKIEINKEIKDFKSLLKKGFSAVLIATGSPKSLPLGIDGEGSDGVIDPLEFLWRIKADKPIDVKGEVVVIGGGSTAFDAARSSIRLGAKKVTLVYRRGYEEMPAEKEEVIDAEEEGVKIITLAIPKKIIVKNKKVQGVEFYKAKLGEPDKSGRRRPIPIKDKVFTVKADILIPAIGAKPDVKNKEIIDNRGRVEVKDYGFTDIKGIFAAGDVETGPSSVVEAIGRGHQAAKGIDSYLRGNSIKEDTAAKVPIVVEKHTYTKSIHSPGKLSKQDRIKSFDEVEKSLNDFEAVEEASRCFTCGPCYLCSICIPNCDHKQLVAKIDNKAFLLKVPSELSQRITKKGTSEHDIKIGKMTEKIKLYSLTPTVNEDLCIGCGRCEEVCSYRAIQNKMIKDEKIVAEVDHDACSSCSACVSVCPTGAISQGYMSDSFILDRIKNKEAKALVSYWNTLSPDFEVYNGAIEIMSSRKISPSFLIKALARSGEGLLIVGPNEKTDSHYLPWEENPLDVIENTKKLLELIGISPERIQYKGVRDTIDPSAFVEDFSKQLNKKKFSKLTVHSIEQDMNPIEETIVILRILGANPDIKPKDAFSTVKPAKYGENVFFEGCLPMLHLIGETHNLYDLSETRNAIYQLLEKLNIKCGTINGFSCPSKGLLDLKSKGLDEIVSKIESRNLKLFKEINPKKLILGTPEAYSTFSSEKKFGKTTSLPDELLNLIRKSDALSPINKTVAVHHACNMKNDPFCESVIEILKLIPGIKVVKINDECGNKGFNILDSNSKSKAIKLMKKAVDKGADTILCTSPYCESHLLTCNREGSWNTVDIEITDVYKLLLISLEGGEL